MTHFEHQKASKIASKIGSERGMRAKIEEDSVGAGVEDKNDTWHSRGTIPRGT